MNLKNLNRRSTLQCGNKQTGALLIESMVAIAVFSIALLSLSGLQLSSSKASFSSALRTSSAIASSEIIDMMRTNIAGVNAVEYDHAYGATLPLASSTIQADQDILQWLAGLDSIGLKGVDPEGQILCNVASPVTGILSPLNCQVRVRWQDARAGAIGQDESVPDAQFEYILDINL